MNKPLLLKLSLVVIVVAIFSYVGTFALYMQIQKGYCDKNIVSQDCYRTYPAFLHKTFLPFVK